MDESLVFEVLRGDFVVCRVFRCGNSYKREFYGDRVDKCFCPLGDSESDIQAFYKERSFDSGRPDLKVCLKELGLFEYVPYDICRKTHGMFFYDDYWIRFPEDNSMSFDEANKSLGLVRHGDECYE